MPDLILIGPQGAGKGTQAELIAGRYGLGRFAPGAYYRAQVEAGTDLGLQVAGYLSKGEIVPTELAAQVLKARLGEPDAAGGLVYDGYPRVRDQAELLDRLLTDAGRGVTLALHLDISEETALVRLAGRLTCANLACGANFHLTFLPPLVAGRCDRCGSAVEKRADDEPDVIRRRLEIFRQETEPLLETYRTRGVLRVIDGEPPVQQVFLAIRNVVESATLGAGAREPRKRSVVPIDFPPSAA